MYRTVNILLATVILTLPLLSLGNPAGHAAESADDTGPEAYIVIPVLKTALARIFPGRQPDSINPAPIAGLYEVIYGADIYYLTADGKYLIQGDIYALDSQTNVTESKRAAGRARLMATVDPETMIIFKPDKTRYIVSVFTDIDCGYCRKLHSEIDSYLDRGIEIRYLAYPRTGFNTPSYFKAVTAWCSKNRQQALTVAKTGAETEYQTCDNPVADHMAVARKLGVTGTPTLILSDGSMLPGYVPADRLKHYLDEQLQIAPVVDQTAVQ